MKVKLFRVLILILGIMSLLYAQESNYVQNYELLFNAVQEQNSDLVRELVANGLDVNTPEGTYGGTALKLACLMNLKNMATLLIELGADVNLSAKDGNNPLLWSSRYAQSSEITQYLIDNGADINHKNNIEENALLAFTRVNAGKKKALTTAEILIQSGIDISSSDSSGKSAIHYAASLGDTLLLKLFLENSADINARDNHKNTPLILASQNGHLDAVSYLLANKANTELRDYLGRGAIYFAEAKKYTQMVYVLTNKKKD